MVKHDNYVRNNEIWDLTLYVLMIYLLVFWPWILITILSCAAVCLILMTNKKGGESNEN